MTNKKHRAKERRAKNQRHVELTSNSITDIQEPQMSQKKQDSECLYWKSYNCKSQSQPDVGVICNKQSNRRGKTAITNDNHLEPKCCWKKYRQKNRSNKQGLIQEHITF